jgi:hypothetical protein
MEIYTTYHPFKGPIIMETKECKRYTWQYKASPVINTIRQGILMSPVLLTILFYVSPRKTGTMS